jgi:predicted RNA-binding Zn ribbon-like protein
LTVSATRSIDNPDPAAELAAPSTEGDPAPGDLELVRALVNTRELDPDREELTDPRALRDWLVSRGLPAPRRLTDDDLGRAREFREAVRSLLLANNGEPLDTAAVRTLQRIADDAPVRLEVGPDGDVDMACSAEGVDALVADVLSAIARAQESGEWARLKACSSGECLWAFYDRSRNRSRHWCSMEVCGNRAKTRAYRSKRSAGSQGRPAR